jgi:hypothetical protein
MADEVENMGYAAFFVYLRGVEIVAIGIGLSRGE